MELLIKILLHTFFSTVLIRLSGFVGNLSISFGYLGFYNFSKVSNLGFNIVYRTLLPAVSIVLLSIFLYSMNLDYLVTDIWLISIWYFTGLFFVILTKNKFARLNYVLFFSTAAISIGCILAIYLFGIKEGITALLPDSGDFKTEIWFIVIIFFYNLLNNLGNDATVEDFQNENLLSNKYLNFKEKYQKYLNKDFKFNKFLNDFLFTIMIVEDLNRPRAFRTLERLFFKFGFVKTTGIMQMKSKKYLNDSESIKLFQDRILPVYLKNKSLDPTSLARKLSLVHNKDAYYRQEVTSIFNDLQYISSDLEEDYWKIL